ncbi:MAG: hypothetical protein ABI318_16820 [Chthoniobacteraceae bacterium]
MTVHHALMMESKTMNPDKTQEPNSEQLLKLLEMQVAAARERRATRDAGRSKAGLVGIFIIAGGATIALWVLSLMLEQMRPHRGERTESARAGTIERAR